MARVHYKELVRRFNPAYIILVETHVAFSSMKFFWESLGFLPIGIVEASGHKGGIWFLSFDVKAKYKVIATIEQCLTIEIASGGRSWVCSAVYGSPQLATRGELWNHLLALGASVQVPWLVTGDFNEILSSQEVKGGLYNANRSNYFSNVLDACNLFDLATVGKKFTWFRRVQGNREVAKKLDRACSNSSWRFMFPEAFTKVLSRLHSDHCPLLIRCLGAPSKNNGRPFRFQAAWATHPSYKGVIHQVCNGTCTHLHGKLRRVQQASQEFNSRVFGNIFVKKRNIESKLDDLQRRLETSDEGALKEEECRYREEYNLVLAQEAMLWSWSCDSELFQKEALAYYITLFCSTEPVEVDCLGDFLKPSLSREACENLLKPVMLLEVKAAVDSMSPFKAPGPDGFQAYFFKEFWDVVGQDVWDLARKGGFIPGRGTPDNIIVAKEVLHFLKKTKSKKGAMAFKIDLEKAYDRVDWKFLEYTLENFGFPSSIINLIMRCIQASSLSILWNENRLEGFQPRRGLRQGDPMSPYLFVLCMEMLACFISHQVQLGVWDPIAVSRRGLRISHLIFADDLLLFCKASKTQVQQVMHSLNLFCKASGLKVNLDKSKAIC
ncbi:uncharacterized protein [Arachis hypogaea]|uniref:uncharacterized protein n=1 Tax=Arachis hypogaea TaxID=3818 RepID=UPI0011056D9A|nr:uncharacterized protein LOC114925788 [Arachis hypogaea]